MAFNNHLMAWYFHRAALEYAGCAVSSLKTERITPDHLARQLLSIGDSMRVAIKGDSKRQHIYVQFDPGVEGSPVTHLEWAQEGSQGTQALPSIISVSPLDDG